MPKGTPVDTQKRTEIKRLYKRDKLSRQELAERFGITKQTVWEVLSDYRRNRRRSK